MRIVNALKQIKTVFRRELNILKTNVSILLILLAAPIAYSFLYTSVFVNKMERDIPVAVIDNDKSELSRELIRHLDAHELLQINDEVSSVNSAYNELQTFKTMAIIIIPHDFERMLKKGVQSKISVSVNNTRFMIANDIIRGVNDVISDMSKNISADFFEKRFLSGKEAQEIVMPLQLNCKMLFNPSETYGDFIIVGLLALILQQTLLMGVSVSMAHERECNTLKDLLHKSSGSVVKMIIGKASVYFIVFCTYAFLFHTLHYMLYKIPFTGSAIAFCVLNFLQFITLIILGFLIATFFRSKLLILIVLAFMSYPVFILSGYSWPIQAFPWFLKMVAFVLPQTPYFQAYTIIAQEGGNIHDIIMQLFHIMGLLIVYYFSLWCRIEFLKRD